MCRSSLLDLRPLRWALLLLVLWAPRAHASEEQFRARFEEAQRLYQQGQYEASIDALRAAYAIKALPRLLLNIGQLQRKLGQTREAVATYQFYLQVDPDPPAEVARDLRSYIKQAEEPAAPRPAPPALTLPRSAVLPAPTSPGLAPPVPSPTPLYKRWWLWTAVGLVAAGAAAGIAVAATRPGSPPPCIDCQP